MELDRTGLESYIRRMARQGPGELELRRRGHGGDVKLEIFRGNVDHSKCWDTSSHLTTLKITIDYYIDSFTTDLDSIECPLTVS